MTMWQLTAAQFRCQSATCGLICAFAAQVRSVTEGTAVTHALDGCGDR
eukprot:COSAG02_NODE_48154_length_336_cov_0.455696_1_plen_47_part_10